MLWIAIAAGAVALLWFWYRSGKKRPAPRHPGLVFDPRPPDAARSGTGGRKRRRMRHARRSDAARKEKAAAEEA